MIGGSTIQRCSETLSKFVSTIGPDLRERAHFIRIYSRQIFRFRPVCGQIIKLPRFLVVGDDFPIADAQGAVAVVIPPEIIVTDRTVLREYWHKALAGRGG